MDFSVTNSSQDSHRHMFRVTEAMLTNQSPVFWPIRGLLSDRQSLSWKPDVTAVPINCKTRWSLWEIQSAWTLWFTSAWFSETHGKNRRRLRDGLYGYIALSLSRLSSSTQLWMLRSVWRLILITCQGPWSILISVDWLRLYLHILTVWRLSCPG